MFVHFYGLDEIFQNWMICICYLLLYLPKLDDVIEQRNFDESMHYVLPFEA